MKLYRPATVLVGVVFVLLGGLTRLAGPDQVLAEPTRQTVRGTIGQELDYNGSTLTVSRIRFAKSFLADENDTDDQAVRTDGVFVAVEYDAARTSPQEPDGNKATLSAEGGSVYRPVAEGITEGVTFPAPGFAETGALVFEVNPADLEGLTLHVTVTQFWTVLAQDVAVDLAVPDTDVAEQLVDRATPQYLLPDPVLRVAA